VNRMYMAYTKRNVDDAILWTISTDPLLSLVKYAMDRSGFGFQKPEQVTAALRKAVEQVDIREVTVKASEEAIQAIAPAPVEKIAPAPVEE